MIKLGLLAEKLPQCCQIDAFSVSLCSMIEEQSLKEFFPECKSVIVFAHHVKHSLEWVWFPLESERNNVTCAADLHLKSECEKIVSLLERKGFHSIVMPYPGRCGVKFKDLADKTGLGKIGDNFMFLHKEWGAWTHIRIIVTDGIISDSLSPCEDVCIHCGNCKTSCPAEAIKNDTLLGVKCGEHQGKRDSEVGIQGSYVFKCEECARACPIGSSPERITISKCS